jgi:tetratricopeptide (TPR) repeat protein
MALQSLARYAEARAAYERAMSVLPADEHERIYRQLGLLAQDQADIPGAEAWYRRAIEAVPTDATAYIYLGAMLAKNGRLDEAEACHRQATECPEGCIDEAYLNLGYVRAQHARLMRLGIPYKADTRLRVERSCIEAEREFARATGCDQATVDRILLKYEQAEELWDPARLADLKIATLRGLHPPRWILWVASAIIRRRAA